MRRTHLAAITTVCGMVAAAAAQNTMTYCWEISDTGDGDGHIEPGESALLTLWATMDPERVGFAGSVYDIIGISNWDTGTVDAFENYLDALTGPGNLQGNGDILGIESFQLPPIFNPNFDASDPIRLYGITWTPSSYQFYWVEFADVNHLNNDVYTDDFGTTVPYTHASCGTGRFTVGNAPEPVECGWALARAFSLPGPSTLAYNPLDDSVYVGLRNSGSDGIYRIAPNGVVTKVVTADRPAGIGVDPVSGDIFFSEDYGGVIYRVELGASTRSTWVSGFRSGDDDPCGIVVVPVTYTGGVVDPGVALSCDRGVSGSDDVWRWSPDAAEGEVLLHNDAGILRDPVDIAVSDERIIVVDDANHPLWEITSSGGELSEVTTYPALTSPRAAVFDAAGEDLLVGANGATPKVVRVRFSGGIGEVTDVILGFESLYWGAIDMRPDGRSLYVADYAGDTVYEFVRTCPADFNHDCVVNTQDLVAFLNAWAAKEERADFNTDGDINTQDVLAFLNAWTAGC